MKKLFNEEVEKQLKEVLANMINPITILMFTDGDCLTCKETKQLLTEVADLNSKISLEIKEIKDASLEVKQFEIELVPSFVILDIKNIKVLNLMVFQQVMKLILLFQLF